MIYWDEKRLMPIRHRPPIWWRSAVIRLLITVAYLANQTLQRQQDQWRANDSAASSEAREDQP